MKRRMLSLLLCLCMAATLLTPTAWAAEGHDTRQDGDEASVTIGDATTYYATLEDAWAAATAGGVSEATVTLLKDATTSECLYIERNISLTFTAEEGATLTFAPEESNLTPGKELTQYTTAIEVSLSGKLYITGGTIKAERAARSDYGTICCVRVSGGKLFMSGGSLVINITGYNDSNLVFGECLYVANGFAEISGGSLTASQGSSAALSMSPDKYSEVTISGNATLTGSLHGINASGGRLNINGGTIKAGNDMVPPEDRLGWPAAIDAGNSTTTITGGTIEGYGGVRIYENATVNIGGNTTINSIGAAVRPLEQGSKAVISGGTFNSTEGRGLEVASGTAEISGGTFDSVIIKDESTYTLADLLKKGTVKTYAYFRDNVQVYDSELEGKTLTGRITVKEGLAENPGPAPSAHQHVWSGDWATDASHHWHNCTAADCPITDNGLKDGAGAHVYDNDADAACNTCGYTRTVSSGDTPVTPPVIDTPVYYPPAPSAPTSSGASNTTNTTNTTPTPAEPAAPVTTTTTDSHGTVTETTTNPDGSSVAVVTQPDGATATVATSASGQVTASVSLPATAVSAAQSSGEAVTLPIPAVSATRNTASAPAVTVTTGSSQPVKVEIPAAAPTPGTVAVLVKADGTEEVIKASVPTADGVAVSLPDGATVKIVDNGKDFADVSPAHWAEDAVDFVTARELFSGTSETAFTPEAPMTRAMLVTVLARLDGADTSGGETWYEKGVEWAIAHDISDGSNPSGNITREQLAVMLWRYAGSPAASGSLGGFTDAGEVSGYAQEAMRWAVSSGIINGLGDGQLAPQGQATRAQVAQMLKNFMESK